MEKKPYVPKKSMKWYNFLVHFGLFAIALIYFICAYNILTGRVYGDDVEYIYYFVAEHEGVLLDVMDFVYGMTFIISGALFLLTWLPLFKKRENGKKLLITSYIVKAAFSFIYLAGFIILLIISDFMVDLMGETSLSNMLLIAIFDVVLMVILTITNIKYFKSRKHLFK